ncbi:MAG TPA: hypothetical protein VGO92_06700 [Acidimicrobiales bacterium]|jgi:hypothetical protein|nr:hypothetical protein [Acidimicrobiales bacterium]
MTGVEHSNLTPPQGRPDDAVRDLNEVMARPGPAAPVARDGEQRVGRPPAALEGMQAAPSRPPSPSPPPSPVQLAHDLEAQRRHTTQLIQTISMAGSAPAVACLVERLRAADRHLGALAARLRAQGNDP